MVAEDDEAQTVESPVQTDEDLSNGVVDLFENDSLPLCVGPEFVAHPIEL